MSIYNPILLLDASNKTAGNSIVLQPQIIIGKIIKFVEWCEGEYIIFDLNDGTKIRISILSEDYNGPEAMDVWLDDGRIIVI